jgi:drug/metabolite transporter (DMT)-like permease
VAVHWITFFHSIKISNVSVALGCFASTTLFASLLEPIVLRRKLNWIEVFIGVVIIAGLYLIFRFETKYMAGIIMSLISAFLAALFTVFNKNLTHKYEPVQISVIELGSGWLGITAYFAFAGHFNSTFAFPETMDLIYLLILAIICTAYAFVVSVDVMKTLSAYTVVLSVNLEPIYGIILAFFIFGDSEYMSSGFYLGTVIILSAVFLYPVLKRKLSRFT